MTPTDETPRGDWLRPRLGRWGSVGGVAGTGFAAYLRVLHPVPVDGAGAGPRADVGAGAGAPRASWPWREVASRMGTHVHPLAQWGSVGGSRDLTFDEPAGPVGISAPQAGRLEPDLLAALVPALASATDTPDDLTLAVWNGWGMPGLDVGEKLHLPGRDYVLRAGALEELADPRWPWSADIAWREPFDGPMPQLIWPGDHAWVVASEIDWDSTIVAGPSALIAALLGTPGIEAFELGEADSLMSDSDRINPPL